MKYFIIYLSLLTFIGCESSMNEKHSKKVGSNQEPNTVDTCTSKYIVNELNELSQNNKSAKISECHKKLIFTNIRLLSNIKNLYSGKIASVNKSNYGFLIETKIIASDYNSVILVSINRFLKVIDFVEVLGGHFAGPYKSKKTGLYFMGSQGSFKGLDSCNFQMVTNRVYNTNLDDKSPLFVDSFVYNIVINKNGEMKKIQVDSIRVYTK